MSDILTPEQRTKNMRSIHSKDTSIEICLRKALWEKGYRYRKNYKLIPGSPDIAITKYRIAVFCDSEFFHGKDWDELKERLEKSERGEYWIKKISKNIERDRRVDLELARLGWQVVRFWGKEIKTNTEKCVSVIEDAIIESIVNNME
ncbi:very short patch repair endonuclease [Butyrivibrio sp. AE2032]|uniref:very short patch repair endonuclease n=1 Tax=Butyrivibrio sp. AE2032 TaxID=1458463 RepID=UPI00054D427F|nr:very short patch repair endonuclease [Butyrivibrio sp. AE2032]